MNYRFQWEPTPHGSITAEVRRVALLSLGVGSVFVCSTLCQVLVSVVCSAVAPSLLSQMWFQLLASTLCLYLFGMLPGWAILRWVEKEPIDSRRLSGLSMAAVVSVAVVLLLVGSMAGNLVNLIVEVLTGRVQENPVETVASNTPLGVLALCTVVLAPIAEELFFRKCLCDRLRRYGDLPAILVSATVFGLAHGNFSQFFYAFLLGLVFGALYCATGRLRYGIALHMGINFFGSVWSTLLLQRVGEKMTVEALLADPIALGMYAADLALYGSAAIAFIPSLILLLRRFRPRRWCSPYTAKQWAQILLLNPALWLCVLVFVGMFLMGM